MSSSVTITTPASNSTVAHTFAASGEFDIDDLGTGNGNEVVSVVTQGPSTLDTKTYSIPSGASTGTWAVEHAVPGSRPLTGCVVTATLMVAGGQQGSAYVANVTISG